MRYALGRADADLRDRGNDEIVEVFIGHMRSLGMDESSVKGFMSALNSVRGFLGQSRFCDVASSDLDAWRSSLDVRPSTLANYCIKVRQFFRWLDLGIDSAVPPLREARVDVILSVEEQEKVFKACRNPRHRLLVGLLWESMMRANELLGVRPMDIRFDEYKVWVRAEYAKFGMSGYAPFGVITRECLKIFFKTYSVEKGERIFPWEEGGVYAVFKRLSERTGLPMKKIHPHVWRHTGITNCLRLGMSPTTLIKLTRHTDIRQLNRYNHLLSDDAMADYGRAFGIADLQGKTAERRQMAIPSVSKCLSCGEVILPGYPVCMSCGYDLNKNLCSTCSKPVDKSWLNCPHCGNKLPETNRCPVCKQPLMQGWKICPICATEITQSLMPF